MSAALPIAMAPTWESYHPATVDATRCIGRRTSEKMADRRWSFAVYGAVQCKEMRPTDGSGDLCAVCCARRTRAGPTNEKGASGEASWQGVVTDMILPDWSHIAGSAWCRSGKPVWLGVERPKAPYVRRAVALPTGTAAPAPAAPPAVVVAAAVSAEDQLAATVMCLEEERAAHAVTAARLAALEQIHSRIVALIVPPPPLMEALD